MDEFLEDGFDIFDYDVYTEVDRELCDLECRVMKRLQRGNIPECIPNEDLF